MDAARRLFVGLRPPPDLAESVSARTRTALGVEGRGLRLVPARDLHMTLCFLGGVLEAHAERLAPQLATVLAEAPALEFVLTSSGAFPARGRERVLWTGLAEVPAAQGRLDALRRAIVRAVEEVGLAPDRQAVAPEFTPHLTVARIRGRVHVPDEFYALSFALPWTVREVHLFESRLAPGEAVRYPAFRSYALGVQPGGAN